MNAVEKLEAAISKLEAQKRDTTLGPWTMYGGEPFGYGIEGGYNPGDPDKAGETVVARSEIADEDVDLIVTLHRTIDAMLALLRLALEYGELSEGTGSRFTAAALALATAILWDGCATCASGGVRFCSEHQYLAIPSPPELISAEIAQKIARALDA